MSHGIEATSYLQHPLVSIPQASLALLPGLPSLSAPLFVPHFTVPPAVLSHGRIFFQGSSLVLGGGSVQGWNRVGGGIWRNAALPRPSTQ